MSLLSRISGCLTKNYLPPHLPPETKSQKLLWTFDEKGLQEGIYNLGYQDGFTDKNWCFSTGIMIALSEAGELTEAVHLEYKTRSRMISRRDRIRYLELPLKEVTPENVYEVFPLFEKPKTGIALFDNFQPCCFYFAGIEAMAWEKQDFDT